MKQIINIRMWSKDDSKGILTPIKADKWDNPYGLEIYIHKFTSECAKTGEYHATELTTGLCLFKADRKKDILQQLEKWFNDPNLTDYGCKNRRERFAKTIQENLKFYGIVPANAQGAK